MFKPKRFIKLYTVNDQLDFCLMRYAQFVPWSNTCLSFPST